MKHITHLCLHGVASPVIYIGPQEKKDPKTEKVVLTGKHIFARTSDKKEFILPVRAIEDRFKLAQKLLKKV